MLKDELMLRDNMKDFYIVVFLGAIWGLVEASLGLLLHSIRFIPTGSILFPIGYYFMKKSYKMTGDISSIFYTSIVAASIKLINLFSPLVPTIKVLNPSFCIILEGIGVLVISSYLLKKEKPLELQHIFLMSIFWRIGYYLLCFTIFIPLKMMKSSSILNMNHFIRFFMINMVVNSILIYIYEKCKKNLEIRPKLEYSGITAIATYILALFVQWII